MSSSVKMKAHAERQEQGFSLIEGLVAIVILSIVSLHVAHSTIYSYKAIRRNERNSIAAQLAALKMEQLEGITPKNLTAANGGTESIVQDGINYTRTATIVVNADKSR